MTEKLDVTKIEAALKRAAHKALYGSREERSGRFLLKADPALRATAGLHHAEEGADALAKAAVSKEEAEAGMR